MNGIEHLVIGKIYTYPQLCEMFGELQKSGNSRKSQIKRWECFFRWTNPTTQQYKIEEIYLEPKIVEDKRKNNGGNNTSKFSEIDDLIMDLLCETNEIISTIPRIGEQIGIFTEQYMKHRADIQGFCKNNGYSEDFVFEYLSNVKSCVHRAIESSIERLTKDGFISTNYYCVLILKDDSTKIISIDDIQYYEKLIEDSIGIKRFQHKNQVQQHQFNQKVHALIEEATGLAVKFYYREYCLKKTIVAYPPKTNGDMWRLTRKFIFTVDCKMINYIYKLANHIYIDDPISQTSYLVSEDYDSDSISSMLKDVVTLSNYFFVYMNDAAWNAYWGEKALGPKDKDLTFMTELLLGTKSSYQENEKTAHRGESISISVVYGRAQAIEELGLDDVKEIERILPDIDWERVYVDEEYKYRYANAIGQYYHELDMFYYSKEKYAEDYSLYVARLVAEGKLDEQMHLFDFVHLLDANDTRYKTLYQ